MQVFTNVYELITKWSQFGAKVSGNASEEAKFSEKKVLKLKIIKTFIAAILTFLLCAVPAFAADGGVFLKRDSALLQRELILDDDEDETVWTADPDGSVLTAWGGVNYYFDQKETYYNLDMSYVVEIAHSQGIEGDYWVRDDGCKMLGDYIMIAANRDVHPQGSIVATSLGLGVVVDTGTFAYGDPTQVDIAVDW